MTADGLDVLGPVQCGPHEEQCDECAARAVQVQRAIDQLSRACIGAPRDKQAVMRAEIAAVRRSGVEAIPEALRVLRMWDNL